LQKPLSKVSITSPGRILFSIFCVVLAVWFSVGWLFSMVSSVSLARQEIVDWELDAQMRSIERRLSIGEDEILILLIPEGTLFCNTLYGFGLISLALTRERNSNSPEQKSVFKQKVLDRIEWLLGRVEKLEQRHPFTLNTKLKPSGGIIIAGHGNLLRAGYARLGGSNPKILSKFDARSKEIYDAFVTGKTAFPECYEGHTWAQDSVFALESLRIHDQLRGTTYSAAYRRWVKSIEQHIDPTTGLMVAQIDPLTDKNIDGSRGCALSWGLAYMPGFAQAFSASQYPKFKSEWFVPLLGGLAIYEWNHGKSTPTNFHAGPVVFGLGAAASGIGIAACRANQDSVSWNKLLRSLEFFGIPTINCAGEKSYFFNLTLLSDVVAFWGKTITPWDSKVGSNSASPERLQQNPTTQSRPASAQFLDRFVIAIATAAVLSLTSILLLTKRSWLLIANKESFKPGWNRATIVVFALHCLSILLFLFCPTLTWMQILVFMAIADLLEELSIRPGIIGKMYSDNQALESR
jgi:hypothetical protein